MGSTLARFNTFRLFYLGFHLVYGVHCPRSLAFMTFMWCVADWNSFGLCSNRATDHLLRWMYYFDLRFLSFQHRKMLYNSLIASHLKYCCAVWGAGPPSRLNGLLSTQNRCWKIMSFTPCLESPKPLYPKYKVLDIYKLVYQAICIFMYRVKCNQAPLLWPLNFPQS